jgi:sugar-specific transcriptional regulator TrmB
MQQNPPEADVVRAIEGLGLSDKEAAVYLALLATGTAPSSSIAKRTGIVKSTAQFTCQQLVKKGMARATRRGKAFLFTCEPPEKLLYLLDRRKRVIDEQEQRVQAVLGRLKGMMNPQSVLPRIYFFEGSEGINEGYRQVLADLQPGDEIVTYLYPLDLRVCPADFGKVLDDFVRGRIEKGVSTRIIALKTRQSELWKRKDASELRETRIVDGLPYAGSAVEVMIYGNKMFSLAVEHDVVFSYLVENESITSIHRAMFELAWEAAGNRA